MKKINIVASVAASALCGAASWFATNMYWKRRNQKEVEAVREGLKEFYEERLKAKDEQVKASETTMPDVCELRKGTITSASARRVETKEPAQDQNESIYIIKPEEYGDNAGWDKLSYLYFPDPDKYVNATYDVPVDDEEIANTLKGLNVATHFGEFEEDAVYVRNEDLKLDVAVYLSDKDFDYE